MVLRFGRIGELAPRDCNIIRLVYNVHVTVVPVVDMNMVNPNVFCFMVYL